MKTYSERVRKTVPQYKRWREWRWKQRASKVGAGEPSASTTTDKNTSFTTSSTTKRLQKYRDQKCVVTSSYLLYFSMQNPVISDLLLGSCQLSSLIFHSCRLKFSEQKQKLSYYEPFWSRPKGAKRVMTLNLSYRANMSKKPYIKLRN